MIPYLGGKFYQSKWIISNFPSDYQKMRYVEVFGGAGWVMLKKEKSKVDVYNDINDNLCNLVRVLSRPSTYKEFKERAKFVLNSRCVMKWAVSRIKGGKFEDEVDRALTTAIMYCLKREGGEGSMGFRNSKKRANLRWRAFYNRLEWLFDRFGNVLVENLDYKDLILRYDHKETLFYLDPPYLLDGKKNNYYGRNWGINEHKELYYVLKGIQGKFLLSYYSRPEIDELYKEYYKIEKPFKKRMSSKMSVGLEVLIANYPLKGGVDYRKITER